MTKTFDKSDDINLNSQIIAYRSNRRTFMVRVLVLKIHSRAPIKVVITLYVLHIYVIDQHLWKLRASLYNGPMMYGFKRVTWTKESYNKRVDDCVLYSAASRSWVLEKFCIWYKYKPSRLFINLSSNATCVALYI